MKEVKPYDIIVGPHSVCEALLSPKRRQKEVFATDASWSDFSKKFKTSLGQLEDFKIHFLSSQELQNKVQKFCAELGFKIGRLPGQVFLKTTPLEVYDHQWLFQQVKEEQVRQILCCDQVTDMQNAAAIMRTAAFYGVDTIVLPMKNSFGLTPHFFRTASGGAEHVNFVQSPSLSKAIQKLKELEVFCLGFSERGNTDAVPLGFTQSAAQCLVLGSEDRGISHSVARQLEHTLRFVARGSIHSLNVSVAAALAMEKCFAPQSAPAKI